MKPKHKRPIVILSALIIAVAIWVASTQILQTPPSAIITQFEFNQVRKGLTYQECVDIFGVEGTPYGSSGMPGEHGEKVDWLSYQWNNPDGSYAEISFYKNRVDTYRSNSLR
jgi:hypothetical protein